MDMMDEKIAAAILAGAETTVARLLGPALEARGMTLLPTGRQSAPCDLVVNIVEMPDGTVAGASERERFADRVSDCLEPAFAAQKAAMDRMRQKGGAVVNLLVGHVTAPEDAMFAEAVRGAMANLSRSVALHAGKSGYGIRVNSIYAPGSSGPDGCVDAMADTIAWLGGKNASFVTGVDLVLSGESR